MTEKEFKALKYGNVLENQDGAEYVVIHVVRDAQQNPTHVALANALSLNNATFEASGVHWEVVSRAYSESYIGGRSIVPPPKA